MMMVPEKPSLTAVEYGLTLPKGYQEAKNLNLVNLLPWHFLSDEEFDYLFIGINKRYPHRRVIPFARRADCDDVACFVVQDPEQASGQIVVIHDFASPGYAVDVRIQKFWDWFRLAVDEMIECLEVD